MLRTFFDLFEVTESQLSNYAMMRLRIAGIIGLLVLPLGVAKVRQHGIINMTQLEYWFDYVFIVAMLGFVVVAATRSVNRLFVPDAYLDESEIERKRKVNGLVFSIIMAISFALLCVLMVFFLSGREFSLKLISGHEILVFMMGIFIPICCIQGLVLSFIAKPLDDDGLNKTMSKQDYKYLIMLIAFVTICTALASGISR